MASEVQNFGPFTEADGQVECQLGPNVYRRWHEITISVFNAVGDTATDATGTLTGAVLKAGADQLEAFQQSLDLSADQRSWDPELSTAKNFYFEVTGLNAGYTYTVMVNSWRN